VAGPALVVRDSDHDETLVGDGRDQFVGELIEWMAPDLADKPSIGHEAAGVGEAHCVRHDGSAGCSK
jgi:hypothetical protein